MYPNPFSFILGLFIVTSTSGSISDSFLDKILDANSFDKVFSKILKHQISQINLTESSNDDFVGIVKRSAPANYCGILPEGEHCEIVSENGRVKREHRYKENYQKPQYSRPQYKKPKYTPPPRQEEKEVISGLVDNGIRQWPEASYLALTVGISVPFIPFGLSDFTLPFVVFLNYLVDRFNNKYQYEDATGARSFGEDQRDMYERMDDILSNTLAVDGRACVKRLICDIAHVPVKDKSFIGNIITEIIEPQLDETWEVDDEYVEAELTGRLNGDCHIKYGRCPFSIKSLLPQNEV